MAFLEELNEGSYSGVAYKNIQQKKTILSYFCAQGQCTLAELTKALNLSVPKVTSLINELVQDGLVQDLGKISTAGGRRPNSYGLVADSVYFIGVDVKQHHVNIGISNLQHELIYVKEYIPFKLNNDLSSLQELVALIKKFIKEGPIDREKIGGMGLNLSGRINYATGYSFSFYHFNEEPLTHTFERELGIKTYLENDSRAIAYGEFSNEEIRHKRNVLFLNLDYGLGMGLMVDNKLYYGKSGFAGEFGHMPIFDNELICACGKRGCLETEASGRALIQQFKEKIRSGSSSAILPESMVDQEQVIDALELKDVIRAAQQDDVLAIELIEKVGKKIGRAMALLINLLNPDLIILGGILIQTGEYLSLPMKSAINKYSLSLVNNDTEICDAKFGEKAGIIGACGLVRNRLFTME